MADAYYIRVRGEIRGPLSREQVLSQIRKKRLGRHHELSEDAVHWQRASDIPGLFESPVAAPDESAAAPAAVAAATDGGPTAVQPAADGDAGAGWYYAKGRNNIGPVTAVEVKSMLATGRLLGTDRVWHSSLDDWTPAQNLPRFMGSVADPGVSGINPSRQTQARQSVPKATFLEVLMGTSKGANLPDDAIYKYPNLSRYLLIAEGTCRILFAILLLAVTAGFIVLVGQQVQTASRNFPVLIGVVIAAGFVLVLQSVILWLLFISCLAALEVIRVLIKIEDNTSQPVGLEDSQV